MVLSLQVREAERDFAQHALQSSLKIAATPDATQSSGDYALKGALTLFLLVGAWVRVGSEPKATEGQTNTPMRNRRR
jgi:hypothetical protein